MEPNRTGTTKPYRPSVSIYDAWKETLLPFLVPAMVLSAWPMMVLIRGHNRTPIKLLSIAALVSLADGLLGSCAFPLQHQYAFSLSENSAFFYAGTVSYWLSGVVLGPLMEMWGCQRSCMALAIVGAAGAWGSGQGIALFALLGRIASAAATSGLSACVECALYHEVHLHHAPSAAGGDDKAVVDSNSNEVLGGGGALMILHQVRPAMLLCSTFVSPYVMVVTPTSSWAPCWVALLCYLGVAAVSWSLAASPPTSDVGSMPATASRPFHVNRSGNGIPATSASMKAASSKILEPESTVAMILPGIPFNCRKVSGPPLSWPQRILRHYVSAYSASVRALCLPRYLAHHIVEIVFGAAFFAGSLLWVPTLELYDESIPFGFVFQLLMITTFLGSTFSLLVWAVGGAEVALVVLLSISERTLSTSRDYAIPVTIMLGAIMLHLTHGCALTVGSLWRAEYRVSSAPLTLLCMQKACTGVLGWGFLHAIDGKYMEDAFLFEAQWMWVLMWVEAVALTQYIVARMAPGGCRRADDATVAKGLGAALVQKSGNCNFKGMSSSSSMNEMGVPAAPTEHPHTGTLMHASLNEVGPSKI
ncbi:hypothetical protein, unknown function [Leishmania tarentolae]|uniref:Uncharacterized protein n=1 Tax=Leishmania tarentolae TaxID=5689 RepID=A0A640K7J8_LEITA|nr:hypothetical protein, unknown function [Leishmania tarentolae]